MTPIMYHNANCGTSRNVLSILTATGHRPDIVNYLETGWTRAELLSLFSEAGITPRDALRVSKSPAEDLGLTAQGIAQERILDAMVEHPILVNRPFVVTAKGTALCRPSEVVFTLLDVPSGTTVIKEDGERYIVP